LDLRACSAARSLLLELLLAEGLISELCGLLRVDLMVLHGSRRVPETGWIGIHAGLLELLELRRASGVRIESVWKWVARIGPGGGLAGSTDAAGLALDWDTV